MKPGGLLVSLPRILGEEKLFVAIVLLGTIIDPPLSSPLLRMCATPDLEVETKSQVDDLRVVKNHRKRCTPCCKWACAAACLLCVVVGVAAGVAAPFALRFQRGMAYMHEMKQHTSSALSLNGRALSWYHLDDQVMGGHSESALEVTAAGGLRFYGNISTRDGGFSSCSTKPQPLGLTKATLGFNVTVSGNGELFKLTVATSDSVWDPVWSTDLPAPSLESGVRHTLLLPLASFTASRMGKNVPGVTLDPAAIQSVGINLALVDMCAVIRVRVGVRVKLVLPPPVLSPAPSDAAEKNESPQRVSLASDCLRLPQIASDCLRLPPLLSRRRHGEPNPHFRDGAFTLTLHSIATYELAAAPTATAPTATAPATTTGSELVAVTPAAVTPALPAAFGSCPSEAQRPLRWGSDHEVANRICCHNSVYAEYGGYWKTTTFLSTEGGAMSPGQRSMCV